MKHATETLKPRLLRLALTFVAVALFFSSAHAQKAKLTIALGHTFPFTAVAYSHNGKYLLTGSGDRTLKLWDIESGKEIRAFQWHGDWVKSVAFSLDDTKLLSSGGYDKTARLWDFSTGHEILTLNHDGDLSSASFSPNGKYVLTSGLDGISKVWNLETQRPVMVRKGVFGSVFSPDGKYLIAAERGCVIRKWNVATGDEVDYPAASKNVERGNTHVERMAVSPDARYCLSAPMLSSTAVLWDGRNGEEIWRYRVEGEHGKEGHSHITYLGFNPDGRYVVCGRQDGTLTLLDTATSREIENLVGHTEMIWSVAFSPDGKKIASVSGDLSANGIDYSLREWDIETGKQVRKLEGFTSRVNSAVFDPNGQYVATGSQDGSIKLWDLRRGRVAKVFVGHGDRVLSVAISPNGKHLVSGGLDSRVRLWDVTTGAEIWQSEIPFATAVKFSANDKYVVVAGDRSMILLDKDTGKALNTFPPHEDFISAADFSPNSKNIASGSRDGTVKLWDVSTGRLLNTFDAHSDRVYSVSFSPRGDTMLSGYGDNTLKLWDITTRKVSQIFRGHTMWVTSGAFSADGTYAVSGSADKTIRLWDVASGKQIKEFLGHDSYVESVCFGFNDKYILSGSSDGTVKLWDVEKGKELATLVSIKGNTLDWAVTDPDGRFDASDPDNSRGLYWLLGDEVIELRQLKERFYTPRLLPRLVGYDREALPRVSGLGDLELWPSASIEAPSATSKQARILLTNRGGGIGKMVVKVNGREIPTDNKGSALDADAASAEIPIDLSGAELAEDGKNTIEVLTYGKSNVVSSRGIKLLWQRAPERLVQRPALHAIVVGVSNYDSPELNLTFSAKDAIDMSHAIEVGGRQLFGVDRLHIHTFASGTTQEPTKADIRRAFETVANEAGTTDVVVVYLSGHGVAGPPGTDAYYYLTREARSLKPYEDPALRDQSTISSAELRTWLSRKGMPLREVVILDTCAAGGASAELSKISDRKELTADQRRAIELLKDATGTHIMMGSAADKASYEASRYGQGLLTYALLLGMRGEALEEGGRLQVRRWFDTAKPHVTEFATGLGGIQDPVISSPSGQTFPIALLGEKDRAEIPLSLLKPQLLKVLCLDEKLTDKLHLTGPVRAELRATTMPVIRGGSPQEASLVYLDDISDEIPDAYKPQVIYNSQTNHFRVRLLRGDDVAAEREFDLATEDAEAMAKEIVPRLLEILPKR